MLVVGLGYPDRPVRKRERRLARLRLGALDAPLDLAYGVDVLVDADPVARPERADQPRHVVGDRVEDAPVAPHRRAPLVDGPAVAEQPLEHRAGVVLHRERRRGRRPGERVDVDAVVAVVAVPDEEAVLQGELERREPRVAAELPRRDLVDRCGQPDVGALGHLRARRAQPARVGARVLGVAVGAVPLRVAVLHVGENQRLVLHRREPLQDGRELQRAALARRRPAIGAPGRPGDRPVREVDEAEPADGARRGAGRGRERRHHRIEQRQGQGRPDTPQERPSRQVLLRDDHRFGLSQREATTAAAGESPDGGRRIWNGVLFTMPRMMEEKR